MDERHPDPIDVAVGARIRARRRQIGVSQQDLASALKLTFQQVQKYESGANRISASMLVKTAEKLNVPVALLVGQGAAPNVDPLLFDLMLTQGAPELLRAYARISVTKKQKLVLELARSLVPPALAPSDHTGANDKN